MTSTKVGNWLRNHIHVDYVSSASDSDSNCSEKSNNSKTKRSWIDYEEDSDDQSVSSNPKRRRNSVLIVNEQLDDSVSGYSPKTHSKIPSFCSGYFSENSNKINVKEIKFPCGKIDGCRATTNRTSNRPGHTFRCLITHAIENGGAVSTSQIITFLRNEFSYFEETPEKIWLPSVQNILKKSFTSLKFNSKSEIYWSIKARYDPENLTVCSTISSVQSYETTDSAKKLIVGLDLDISEDEIQIEQNLQDVPRDSDLDNNSDFSVDNCLWHVKQIQDSKILLTKISETCYSRPKLSIAYIAANIVKDQPLTKEEIYEEIQYRYPFYKNHKDEWRQPVNDVLLKNDYFLPKKVQGCAVAKWSIDPKDYQRLHQQEFRSRSVKISKTKKKQPPKLIELF